MFRRLACLTILAVIGVIAAETSQAAPTATPATARQLAGERVIYSYHGLTAPRSLLVKIRAGEAAGVVLFKNNIVSAAQISGVIRRFQQAAAESPVKLPLLIMTDQEGGEVRRLPGAPALSEKQIGETSDPGLKASDAGRNSGANLGHAGINVNLAPVLDVYRQAGDFDDHYGRSYSSAPRTVAALGAGFIKAQQQRGVAATAKHFPGLGAATTYENTDTEPVVINDSLATLRGIDELPYKSAIATGVRLVMVSWATYPALDGSRPAGLSETIVQNELRRHLGFKGVTITDALEAGALKPYGGTGNRAVLASAAGMDLLLCSSQHIDEGIAAVNGLTHALTSGKLNSAAFSAAAQRVTALRESLKR